MKDVHIRADRIGLDLPVYTQDQRSTRASLSLFLKAAFLPPKRELRTTLDDVSFELLPGDRVGVIGRNGAGKSTLLKVLVGAYPPSRGTLSVAGTRQALLNLSLGFSPEATLVENIILRAIAMGRKPAEAVGLVDDVLAFGELEEKANDRLRTLSSGQKMRLGFSIATASEHQILIMDEWIGTGDAAFVEKAKERMRSRVDSAQIVMLASHNAQLLRSVCNKAILLEKGRLVQLGEVDEVISTYRTLIKQEP
ncbi:ATP-binding cassette domain-containing protein [Luteimonas sp. RD2P54]|uniref:ATP-binding cassette domain-containing protein n=1 Tax=Luteimonas endophytica TaxID=3042023 RepID=A0ABT6J845_9GAMM|nr:ATP-binding cassette domain-containing protein [Luteimonas endophytica]MDH5822990.1 ATP-binding cassette domain-containing protein [Luteimonas endophytica]